jgi:hypothetical protein
MNAPVSIDRLSVGNDLYGPVRVVTPERIEWYDSAMLSASVGELRQVGSNIHTDEEYARQQGFEAVNADGMIMTNWCSTMLVNYFGVDYVERGELRTKFIKPVQLRTVLHVRGRVQSIDGTDNGKIYAMDVWCEDENGVKLVDGDAKVEVRRRS